MVKYSNRPSVYDRIALTTVHLVHFLNQIVSDDHMRGVAILGSIERFLVVDLPCSRSWPVTCIFVKKKKNTVSSNYAKFIYLLLQFHGTEVNPKTLFGK